MVENKELYEIFYVKCSSKSIYLSEEQMVAFKRTINAVSIFCTNLQEIVSAVFQQEVKPIADTIKEFISEVEKIQSKIKIKYDIIKEIKPNQYQGLNKPRLIHCRNNC